MFKENGTLIILFFLVFLMLGSMWWFSRQGKNLGPVLLTTVSPTAASQIDSQAIKNALAESYGRPVDEVNLGVSSASGNYARGWVSFSSQPEVWLWLAHFSEAAGQWQLIGDGQGLPLCQALEEVNFPIKLAGECWDEANQQIINR